MTSIAKRILTAVIALPILFCLVVFLPQMNHAALMVVILAASVFGTVEMASMVSKRIPVSRIAYAAPLITLCEYVSRYFYNSQIYSFYMFTILLAIILSREVFSKEDDFSTRIAECGADVLVLVYPGLLSIFIVDLLFLEASSSHILLYFALVFGCDTFAYFSGLLFGKGNRGIIKVSPNKSIAGFIGGVLVPALIGGCAAMLFPSHFHFSIMEGFFIGALVSIFGELGDLVESTFKRSAGIKDSGFIIPGRGGILDSIDSLLFAAPIFILSLKFFDVV